MMNQRLPDVALAALDEAEHAWVHPAFSDRRVDRLSVRVGRRFFFSPFPVAADVCRRFALQPMRVVLLRKLVLNPELGLGEAYTDGTLTVDGDDIGGFLSIVIGNIDKADRPLWQRLHHALRTALEEAVDEVRGATTRYSYQVEEIPVAEPVPEPEDPEPERPPSVPFDQEG